jgi:hypothetical protein
VSQLKIRKLIETRLSDWATDQGLTVAYENATFSPPAGLYLEAFQLKAGTNDEFVEGGHHSYVGVYQISIHAPLKEGAGPAGLLVLILAALFPNNLELDDGNGFKAFIRSPLDEASGITSATRYTVPTSFEYRADTP